MKKILYIGNKLFSRGLSPTTVDTLAPLLNTIYDVTSVSDKKNILIRALDIILNVIKLRKKIDLIILDTYSTKNFYIALVVSFLCRIFNLKYITYLHGGNLPKRIISNPKLSDFIFKNSYINVAPSNYIGESFIRKSYKTVIIPNNINLKLYKFLDRKKLQPKLLYVRAFEKVYNPTMAVEVLNNIIKQYPNAELCMVGPDKDGTLFDVEKLVEKYNLQQNVKITGRLSKQEWINLSQEYDIFINTTNYDNQPVSVIEAMALGLTVISTNVGGIPYLIENNINGLLVDKNDVDNMTKQILKLLNDKEIANNISLNARKKADEFDWQNIKERWKEIIDDIS